LGEKSEESLGPRNHGKEERSYLCPIGNSTEDFKERSNCTIDGYR
jgi:hypothetical protein